jgi:hypothetical protein
MADQPFNDSGLPLEIANKQLEKGIKLTHGEVELIVLPETVTGQVDYVLGLGLPTKALNEVRRDFVRVLERLGPKVVRALETGRHNRKVHNSHMAALVDIAAIDAVLSIYKQIKENGTVMPDGAVIAKYQHPISKKWCLCKLENLPEEMMPAPPTLSS